MIYTSCLFSSPLSKDNSKQWLPNENILIWRKVFSHTLNIDVELELQLTKNTDIVILITLRNMF